MITINIPVYKISPHPDNPRKDVGDVSELAESIKKNGIMQNLTVIPKEEGITKTDQKKIFIGNPGEIDKDEFFERLTQLKATAYANKREDTVRMVIDMVPTFRHDALSGLKTVHHGQHDVHDDQVRTKSGRGLHRARAVGGHARGPAFRRDALRDGRGQLRCVFDHQNGMRFRRCGLC